MAELRTSEGWLRFTLAETIDNKFISSYVRSKFVFLIISKSWEINNLVFIDL